MQFSDQMSQFGTKAWVRENERRAAHIQALYDLSDRSRSGHEHHECFTGLFQERVAALVEGDRRMLGTLKAKQ